MEKERENDDEQIEMDSKFAAALAEKIEQEEVSESTKWSLIYFVKMNVVTL